MYSSEAKSTAIAYRLIHENLPKFIDNMAVFESVAASPIAEQFPVLYKDFEECLNVTVIGEIFALNYYNYVLTQSQIDLYNAIIGGKVLADGTKVKGLNEYINLYYQQQTEKSKRLPRFKVLFKQILSDRNSTSWLPEQFLANDDEAVLEAIQKAYQELDEKVINRMNDGEHSLKSILQSLNDYDLNKIYIRNDSQISDLSQKIFGHWAFISDALLGDLKRQVPKKSKRETDEAYEGRLKTILKSQGSISIAQINEAVNCQTSILAYFAAGGGAPSDSTPTENFFARIHGSFI